MRKSLFFPVYLAFAIGIVAFIRFQSLLEFLLKASPAMNMGLSYYILSVSYPVIMYLVPLILYVYLVVFLVKGLGVDRLVLYEVKAGLIVMVLFLTPFLIPTHYPVAWQFLITKGSHISVGFLTSFPTQILNLYVGLGNYLHLYTTVDKFTLDTLTLMGILIYIVLLFGFLVYFFERGPLVNTVALVVHCFSALVNVSVLVVSVYALFSFLGPRATNILDVYNVLGRLAVTMGLNTYVNIGIAFMIREWAG